MDRPRTAYLDRPGGRIAFNVAGRGPLVIMGSRDADSPDPEAEAGLVAGRLNGRVLMVSGAGHYPQAEYPEVVNPAVIGFLDSISRRVRPYAGGGRQAGA
ncbi:MAG: alpha/beta hydrolase [Acidobacteriota bacterium]